MILDSNGGRGQTQSQATGPPRWLSAARAVIGQELHTVWGRPVTLVRVDDEGLTFRTAQGRQMPTVPLDGVSQAVAMTEQGANFNAPWELRIFAGVELSSYVWALLHDERFRRLAAPPLQSAAPARRAPIAVSADGSLYLIHVVAGHADPRPPEAGATWDESLDAWTIARTTDDRALRRARALLADELPGGGEAGRPYVIAAGTRLFVHAPFGYRETLRGIGGGYWDPEARCWSFPRRAAEADALTAAFGPGLLLSRGAQSLLARPYGTDGEHRSAAPVSAAHSLVEAAPKPQHEPAAVPEPDVVSTPGEFEPELIGEGVAETEPEPEPLTQRKTAQKPEPAPEDEAPPPIDWTPAIAWLDGALEELPATELRPATFRAITMVARGHAAAPFDASVAYAPVEAALLLAVAACTVHGARTPLDLTELAPREPTELAGAHAASQLQGQALAFARAEPVHDGLALAGILLAAANGDGDLVEAWAAIVGLESTAGIATLRWLAAWRGSPLGTDGALAPAHVDALARGGTVAECSRLAFTACSHGHKFVARSLIAALTARLGADAILDPEAELIDPLLAAEDTASPHWPELADRAATLIENGDRLPAPLLATKTETVYVSAYRAADAFHDVPRLRTAWERLLRWFRGRGELAKGLDYAERLRFRQGFETDAPIAAAYLLAEQGDLGGAVSGLVEAGSRLRPVRPVDADDLFREARLLQRHLPDGVVLVPEEVAPEGPAALAWPAGKRVVLAGGTDRMRAWTLPLLQEAGIQVRWLTTDEALRGDEWPALVAGKPDFTVLLIRHIPHSVTRRAESAAFGVVLTPYPAMGTCRLPTFLHDLAAGIQQHYRPSGH